MDSIQTHYAAQRDADESPTSKPPVPPIRIPKRPVSHLETPEPSNKRMRNALVPANTPQSRFLEGRREESMSEHGRDIQNLTRQEFQKRLQMKLASRGGEDSVEMESRRLAGKADLGPTGDKYTLGKRATPRAAAGKIIPVKHGVVSEVMEDSPSLSLSAGSSRDVSVAIKPPGLSAEEPSIILVPGEEPTLPQDKKVPTKHTPKTSKLGSRALVIPAAKPAKKVAPVTRSVSARSVAPSTTSFKPPLLTATFTMGSIPTNTNPSPYRKSQRLTSRTISPAKARITRSASSSKAVTGKELTIRPVRPENKDIQVPVKFGGPRGKRKYAETDDASPTKRIRLNEVTRLQLVD